MEVQSWVDFSGKKVALLGAGIENIALIPHLLKARAAVSLCDKRPRPDLAIDSKVKVVTGDNYLSNLDQYDFVFRIAGLPVATVTTALEKLSQKPVVTSAADLFLALRPCHIIGVTGTKGKGTTATFIGSMLKAAGHHVVVTGNIGEAIFSHFNDLKPESYAVVELSSFQLEDVTHSPETAVLVPITEDHLQPLSKSNPNFHPTVNDYVAAKAGIAIHQSNHDTIIFAANSDFSASIAHIARSRKIAVSQTDYTATYFVNRTGAVFRDGQKIIDLEQLGLKGQHIFLNATLAIAVAQHYNCSIESISQGIINFRPLPHRLEQFFDQNGIIAVDDSYATTPDAAIAAIETFTQPIIWIGGGSSKGANFDELARRISLSTIKKIILLGQEGPRIAQSLSKLAPEKPIVTATSLDQVVKIARDTAVNGDVILLSPACASKDMFTNTAERGEQFQRLVAEIQDSGNKIQDVK